MSPYELALAEGYVPEMYIRNGRAVATVSREYPRGIRHAEMDMRIGKMLAPTPPAPVVAPLSCKVGGVEVEELAIMVKPCAFFVTTEHGTHEINRCYFQKGKFQYGVDMQRLGGVGTRSAEYIPGQGLRLHMDFGYEVAVPDSHCQATWRLPEQK